MSNIRWVSIWAIKFLVQFASLKRSPWPSPWLPRWNPNKAHHLSQQKKTKTPGRNSIWENKHWVTVCFTIWGRQNSILRGVLTCWKTDISHPKALFKITFQTFQSGIGTRSLEGIPSDKFWLFKPRVFLTTVLVNQPWSCWSGTSQNPRGNAGVCFSFSDLPKQSIYHPGN